MVNIALKIIGQYCIETSLEFFISLSKDFIQVRNTSLRCSILEFKILMFKRQCFMFLWRERMWVCVCAERDKERGIYCKELAHMIMEIKAIFIVSKLDTQYGQRFSFSTNTGKIKNQIKTQEELIFQFQVWWQGKNTVPAWWQCGRRYSWKGYLFVLGLQLSGWGHPC